MNTKHYTNIPMAKTLWKFFLVLGLLCTIGVKAQDCMLLPMTLQQRVQASPMIIEGEVLSQQSFWSQGHQTIYTLNKVKVYKVFKGTISADVIDVITEGGTVGMSRIVHSATLALNVGDMGVLMCIPNPFTDSGISGYTPYGSLAGFFRYEPDGSAHDPYRKYNTIEADLYQDIKNSTNKKFTIVNANPKLTAIFNKNAGGNGNGLNKNINVGGNQVEATPTISSFTPTSVAAGVGTTITISGNNFGATRGTGAVEFKNADDGGASWMRPLSTDYVSWNNTTIVVKVPSTNASGNGAGTGQIRVVNSDASSNTATSSQTLTVTYAYSNVIYDNTARMATHIKDNTAGGYTFLLDQSSAFSTNTPAVNKLRLVMDRWTCTSGINWLIGGSTTGTAADDGLNIVCFSASLPASTLARCTSYYSGCGTSPFEWYVKEIDVAVKSNMPAGTSWYYGTGSPSATEYDFETVMLHEIGHGHQLNHVIDASAVMHYAVGAGETKRNLSTNDDNGADFVRARSITVGGICGQSAMTLLTCGAGNGAPIVNFSASRTNITAGCSITFTSEALPQATAWSWNFNGGATNSTLENPTVTFNLPGTYTVSLTATNANGSNTTTRTNYIVVSAVQCSATNTNWSGSNVDYNAAGSGKLVGHNAAGDLAFADKFLHCGTATKLTQLKYYFNLSSGTGNITAKVWNANGAGGSPGTELFSQTVAISALPDFPTTTNVNIPSGLLLTGDYFIGFEIAYAGSDAVSLISNAQGESAVSSAWRKSSGGSWDSYLALYGSSLSLRIEGVINNSPTATITPAGPTTFCSGSNVMLNANTGSGLTYMWFRGGSPLGISTSNYQATVSGSYTVQVTSSGCSTTSSATVVTVNTCASTNANLSGIVLSSGTLNPAFAQATTSYTASVSNATTAITLTPTVADATATVKVNNVTVASGSPSGAIALNVGANVITTVVTAEDGTTTKTYTVTVTRAGSSNANLSNLNLSAGSLNPAFAQATTSYMVSVGLATTSTTVTPTVADPTAIVHVNGNLVTSGSPSGSIALSVGPNVIGIQVTAQDGTTKNYSVTVMRLPSSNSNLSNLTLSAGTLNPAFAQGTTSYTASVPNATTSMTVTPTVADATATVRINGQVVTSGSPSQSIALNAGSNIIVAEVTAQDGTTITSYTVTVTRAFSSNAFLFSLTLSSGTLNPVFAQATTSYSASVSNATTSMTVTLTAADPTASVEVNGQFATSGVASQSIALNVGANVITVEVTAQDGTTVTPYTVTVTRAASSNANLSNLTLSSGTLNPVFAQATTSYTASVSNATTSMTVTPTIADATAVVRVNGQLVTSGSPSQSIALNVGSNLITVEVTAQNGTTKSYTVSVTRLQSSNADLANLVANSWSISPDFSPATTDYSLSVSYNTTTVTITPTVADAGATVTVNSVAVTSGTPSGSIGLNVGDNTITTTVTAQDGSTKTYIVHVTRLGSSYLTNLVPSSGSLSPSFNMLTFNYTVNVNNSTNFISFVPTAEDATATIRVNGNVVQSGFSSFMIPLSVGNNSVLAQVEASTGGGDVYSINVVRATDSNADLSNLTVNAGTLNPAFSSGTNIYSVTVPNGVSNISFTPTASSANATITVNSNPVASGSPSGSMNINLGGNLFTILVTAQNGATNTYTINVTRLEDSNADLSNLTVSAGTLNPAFAPGTNNYTVNVPVGVSNISFTPTASSPTATITVNGDSVASGSPSGNIPLSVGSNIIPVAVFAQDGSMNVYVVEVIRAAANSDANLSGLGISSGTLNPAFASGTLNYSAVVDNSQSSITVTPTASAGTSTITVNGISVNSGNPSSPVALNAGNTTITIIVTAQNGATQTYTITIIKRPTAVISGTQTVCSTNPSASLTIELTGTAPWNLIFYNGTTFQAETIFSSPHTLNVLPSTTTTYTIADLSDANLSALPGDLSGSATVTVAEALTYYADADGDGFGNAAISQLSCSVPIISGNPAVLNNTDCNDADENTFRTATFFIDVDGDGYDNGSALVCYGASIPFGYSNATGGTDCNDNDETVHEQFAFYADNDGDTFGAATPVSLCAVDANTPPFGYVTNGTDCDDNDNTVYQSSQLYTDNDNDGYDAGSSIVCYGENIPGGYSATTSGADCDDSDNSIFLSAVLYVDADGDGYDAGSSFVCAGSSAPPGFSFTTNGSDCDDNDNSVHQQFTFYSDNDGDTFGAGSPVSVCAVDANTPPLGYATNNTDCDDNDAGVYITGNLYIDFDGDNYNTGTSTICYGSAIPPGFSLTTLGSDCDDFDNTVYQSNLVFIDVDGDGYDVGMTMLCYGASLPTGYSITSTGFDCNDNDSQVHQAYPFYADADGDTFGAGSPVNICTSNPGIAPPGYSVNNNDCDDNNPNAFQSMLLYIDNDGDFYSTGSEIVCYGSVLPPGYLPFTLGSDCNDNNFQVHQGYPFYADADGDSYGAGSPVSVCAVDANSPPTGYSLSNTDCDDNDNTVYQSASLFIDADGDNYNIGSTTLCYGASVPAGYSESTLGTDCDDTNAALHEQFSFYADNDGDSYGSGSLVNVCALNATTPPAGYALNNTDCDDNDNTVYQSALLYIDADGDTYTNGVTQTVCYGAFIPSGYIVALTAIDCNDNTASIHPNATEILGNGIDDNCNGATDEGGTGITTTLLPAACGVTLPAIGTLIGIQTVGGHPITGYRIRATNGAQVQMIETIVPHFTMPQFPIYAYATTYTIDIQLQRAGIWQTSWGAPCFVSTPAILETGGAATISPSQCGIVLPKINTLIATSSIQGVTGYRFRVTNLTDTVGPNAVQTIDRTQNWFSLQMLTRYNYGTTYRIEVAVKTNGSYSNYGAPCQVTSPAVPSLINCGGTVASGTTTVAAFSVSGATQYRFQITRDSDGASTTIDRNSNYFIFNSVPASLFTPGALYNIRVAVMTTSTWSPYSDVCQITAPGGVASGITAGTNQSAADVFRVVAYPAPFTADFGLDVITNSRENVNLKVYDMLGKLIESREITFEDLSIAKIGATYPSGVYNVIVSQDGIVKTIRVVKR